MNPKVVFPKIILHWGYEIYRLLHPLEFHGTGTLSRSILRVWLTQVELALARSPPSGFS